MMAQHGRNKGGNMESQLEQAYEAASVLFDDITYLESELDKLAPESLEYESKNRVLNVKWRLYSETRDKIDRLEDKQSVESAQARWKWHETSDTLDLY